MNGLRFGFTLQDKTSVVGVFTSETYAEAHVRISGKATSVMVRAALRSGRWHVWEVEGKQSLPGADAHFPRAVAEAAGVLARRASAESAAVAAEVPERGAAQRLIDAVMGKDENEGVTWHPSRPDMRNAAVTPMTLTCHGWTANVFPVMSKPASYLFMLSHQSGRSDRFTLTKQTPGPLGLWVADKVVEAVKVLERPGRAAGVATAEKPTQRYVDYPHSYRGVAIVETGRRDGQWRGRIGPWEVVVNWDNGNWFVFVPAGLEPLCFRPQPLSVCRHLHGAITAAAEALVDAGLLPSVAMDARSRRAPGPACDGSSWIEPVATEHPAGPYVPHHPV